MRTRSLSNPLIEENGFKRTLNLHHFHERYIVLQTRCERALPDVPLMLSSRFASCPIVFKNIRLKHMEKVQ